jgi:dihydrofolate synthase/folylpolyglutamate synthase
VASADRDDVFAWLTGLELFGIKLGLANISTVLDALGHPEQSFRVIHVGGTNGKGSVTAMIDASLRAAGVRTGCYTSPHLVDLTERFVVNGAPVDRRALADALHDIRARVDGLQHSGDLQHPPTFFEATTAAAFEVFRRSAVEVAVCEVGLGGRLDATNVVSPIVTVITSVGLDHEQHLGPTLSAIAGEKAGIIKRGIPLVIGRLPADAEAVVAARARELAAPLVEAHDGATFTPIGNPSIGQPTRGRLVTPQRDYGELSVGLSGRHQIDNAVVAVRLNWRRTPFHE